MTDQSTLTVHVTTPDGAAYTGSLAMTTPSLRPPMITGLSPSPKSYGQWFTTFADTLPAFSRVFSPPRAGLPQLDGIAITGLPTGCLPWISHKDQVPLPSLGAFWDDLKAKYDPPGGRRFRWTPQHELAPADAKTRVAYLNYLDDVATLAEGYPWIEVVQIQSNYAMRWRDDVNWRDWLIKDISIGFDSYDPEFGTGYEPPASMFGLLQHAAAVMDAPSWYVPELGSVVRGGSPAQRMLWTTDCVDYLAQAGCTGVGLWCGEPETRQNKLYDYRPTDLSTQTAYRKALAR